MTMSLTSKEVEYLVNEIFQNERPVSYHKISRQLNIPIDKAKVRLYEYYEKNRDTLAATFLITGFTATGRLIKLSKDESNLDEDVKRFTSISTIHIYSVGQRKLDFSTNDLALEESRFPSHRPKLEQYEKNGIIIGPRIVDSDVAGQAPHSSTPESAEESTEESKSTNIESSTISSSYVSIKTQPKTGMKTNTTLSYYSSPEQERVTRAATELANHQCQSRKVNLKQLKGSVEIADHTNYGEFVAEDVQPEPGCENISTVDLEELFEDIFIDSNEANYGEATEKNVSILISEEVGKLHHRVNHTKEIPMEVDQEVESSSTPDRQEILVSTDANQIEMSIDPTRNANLVYKPAKLRSHATATVDKKPGYGKKVQASVMGFFQKG